MTASASPVPARGTQESSPPKQASWERFERDLAAALAAFDREFLVLDVKGTPLYVQVHANAGGFRCETVSNRFLPPEARLDDGAVSALGAMGWSAPAPGSRGSPNFFRDFEAPARPADVARLLVRTLAEVHGIPGPDRLEYTAFDGEGHDALLPALGIAQHDVEAAASGTRRKSRAHAPAARLRRRVLAELRHGTGDASLAPDADGDVGVWLGSDLFAVVRVFEQPLAVRVSCLLAEGLAQTRGLLLRLQELNATLTLERLVLVNGAVFLSVDLPAAPFRVEHLRLAAGELRRVVGAIRQRLAEFLPAAST